MSSPDYGSVDDSPSPAATRVRSHIVSDAALLLRPKPMDVDASSTTREHIGIKDDDVEELMPMGRQSSKVQTIHDSSDDDEPIAATCQRRNAHPPTHETTKPSPKKPAKKAVKKPGPSTYGSKPIMKNDMKAKKAMIKEIESYWGKNFIKSYIPKCHRPLVKRGIHGKRSVYRDHEADPKKWLPSVLKAILMIAKLTNNKKWLSQAMTGVVRYRIKNTGNRKPQLVTTDFDVIEDMLVKNWKEEYSFGIRYKYLLVNRKDQEEDDDDVDRILQVASSDKESGSVSNDEGADQDDSGASDSGSDDDATQQDGGGVSDGYQMLSGYHQPSQSVTGGRKNQTPKREVVRDESPMRPPPPPPGMYGDYYGRPPTDLWGRPMTMPPHGYGGYIGYGRGYSDYNGYKNGYSGYPPYGQPQFPVHSRQTTTQQPPYQPHQRDTYPSSPRIPTGFSTNCFTGMYAPPHQPMMTPSPNTPGFEGRGRELPKIKRESPGAEEEQVNDFGNPMLFGRQGVMAEDAAVAGEEVENIDAEVAAAEAELKLARLRAKRARMARK